jgi:hypothetical protein
VPFYIRKKNYSPKIENRKNENRGFFGRKLFIAPLWQVFFINKTEAPEPL